MAMGGRAGALRGPWARRAAAGQGWRQPCQLSRGRAACDLLTTFDITTNTLGHRPSIYPHKANDPCGCRAVPSIDGRAVWDADAPLSRLP